MFRVIHPNRWFFWAIAVIVIGGLIVLYFINQATVQDIENDTETQASPIGTEQSSDPSYFGWRAYTSETLGISVKYPPTWQIDIDPTDSKTVFLENPENFSENVALSIRGTEMESVIRSSLNFQSETRYMIDGASASWLKSSSSDPATQNVVLVKLGGKLYYIAGQAQAFEKIISSIRFLK